MKIKPLKWTGNNAIGGGYIYEISEPSRTPGWRVWVRPDMGTVQVVGSGIVTVKAKDRDDAIAAAQADYERRILSAIHYKAMTNEIIWKDASNYQHGERGKIAPTGWECHIDSIRIWIGNNHRYYPGQWVMHCAWLDIDTFLLDGIPTDDAAGAQAAALNHAVKTARINIKRLSAFAQKIEVAPLRMKHRNNPLWARN